MLRQTLSQRQYHQRAAPGSFAIQGSGKGGLHPVLRAELVADDAPKHGSGGPTIWAVEKVQDVDPEIPVLEQGA